MKHLLILFALLLASTGLQAHSLATRQEDPKAAKAAAKKARKARRQKGPEVYKGSVAEQQRLIEDAPDAEKDADPDKASRKAAKMAQKEEK